MAPRKASLVTIEFPETSDRSTLAGETAIRTEPEISLQRHYSIREVARLWGLNEKTVRRIFATEPGVIELANEESRFKRSYITRRIPEAVLRRVHCRLRKIV